MSSSRDSGTRYLSKIYNDNWMRENQYMEPALNVRASQVVREKVRRADSILSLELAATIEDAVNLMREHEISQVPVIEGGSVVGSISEARILEVLVSDPSVRSKSVAEHMEPPFVVLPPDAPINMLAEHMRGEMTAVPHRERQGVRHHHQIGPDPLSHEASRGGVAPGLW